MAGIIFYICLYFQLSFVQFLILLIVLLAEWSAIICLYLFTLSNYFVFLILEFFLLFCSGEVLFVFVYIFVCICLYFQFSISEGILLITIKQVLLPDEVQRWELFVFVYIFVFICLYFFICLYLFFFSFYLFVFSIFNSKCRRGAEVGVWLKQFVFVCIC